MLNSVLEYYLPIAQATGIMGVSERHTKRLLAAYRKAGPAALAHGNRGRRPHNAVPDAAAAAVATNGYANANHTHFTELLREREGIDLSRPTVRRVLVKAGLGSPRSRRSQQHRFRRRRMPGEGMLVQPAAMFIATRESDKRGEQRSMAAPLHLVRQPHAMQQQKQVRPVGPVSTIHLWQMFLQVPHVDCPAS